MQLTWMQILYEGRFEILECGIEIITISSIIIGAMFIALYITNRIKEKK